MLTMHHSELQRCVQCSGTCARHQSLSILLSFFTSEGMYYVSQSLTSWVRQQKNTYLYSTHMAFTWWRGEERTDIETDFFSVKPFFNTILVDVRKKVNGPIGYLCYGCQYGNTGCRVFKRGYKINIHKENYWILRIGLMGSLSSLQKSELILSISVN